MQKNIKSLPKYVLDENHFKDFEYEFDYCIIHKENDNDYFNGTTTSALAEYNVFKDAESFAYFIDILSQSKILIHVDICPPGKNDESIIKLPYCENDNYFITPNANIVPQIKNADKYRCLSIFLSIREIHHIAHNHIFLYIDFETIYKWIKKHHKKIDIIAFNLFEKHDYSSLVETDKLIKYIKLAKKYLKNYDNQNLRNISIQKHKHN